MKSGSSSRPSPLRSSRGNEAQMSLMTFRESQGLAASTGLETTPPTAMPLGISEKDVPEGQMKVAQRFNAGMYATSGKVPKGRLKGGTNRYTFSRPFGTRILSTTILALKRRVGYYREVPLRQISIEIPKCFTHNPALRIGWGEGGRQVTPERSGGGRPGLRRDGAASSAQAGEGSSIRRSSKLLEHSSPRSRSAAVSKTSRGTAEWRHVLKLPHAVRWQGAATGAPHTVALQITWGCSEFNSANSVTVAAVRFRKKIWQPQMNADERR